MSSSEALDRLRIILAGLGMYCAPLKTRRKNAQRKFTRKPAKHKWLTVVIWTTITAAGPLPGKRLPVQIILFGNKTPDRFLWIFKGTMRFRKKRVSFAKRLRRRAELAIKLSESVQCCTHHAGVMTLKVRNNTICWCCVNEGCNTCIPIDPTLSKQIERQTPRGFWLAQML
jgi:hypothetical protein